MLAPGQTANAALGVAEAGNFPASTCKQVTAHWLKVFPPDQTVAAYVAFTTQTCSSTSVATMRIAADQQRGLAAPRTGNLDGDSKTRALKAGGHGERNRR